MKELDIRPKLVFDDLISSAKKATEGLFSHGRDNLKLVGCPACCEEKGSTYAFWKEGFPYFTCDSCGSLYVSKRPSIDFLSVFYSKLDSFGAFYAASAEKRLEAIVRPRARMIVETAREHGITGTFCDIGCGNGVLLKEVESLKFFSSHLGIDPSEKSSDAARLSGFAVAPYNIEEGTSLNGEASFATAFEVLEHVFSPMDFLLAARKLLIPGGILVLTTLTSDGWDISELWQYHKSICPPMHLNFLSITGLESLVRRCGFELVELTTPGQLDVDIVINSICENNKVKVSRFANRIAFSSEKTRNEFQKLLRENMLSSHVQVIVKRTGDVL